MKPTFRPLPMDPYLESLATGQSGPYISIYLPTHPAGPETAQDRIRLKNMLHVASTSLVERGLAVDRIDDLLAPATALLEPSEFWRQQRLGLALFLSSDGAYECRLPYAAPERLIIDDQFAVRPLLRHLSSDLSFYLIAISQREIRLFRGRPDGLQQIDLPAWPENLSELESFIDAERSLQFHTAGGPSITSGRRAVAFHGQGGERPPNKVRILEFFQLLDRSLHDLLQGESDPLIPVGVERVVTTFREACTYPHLVEQTVEGNPERMNETELLERARQVTGPMVERQQSAGLQQFRLGKNAGRDTTDFAQIELAARYGQVETLLVDAVASVPHGTQTASSQPRTGGTPVAERCDRLDEVTMQALRTSARAYAYDSAEMPEGNACAAVLRPGANPVPS